MDERIDNDYFNVDEDRDVNTIYTPLSDDLKYFQDRPPVEAFGFKLKRDDESINCFFVRHELSAGDLRMALRCASFDTKIVQLVLTETTVSQQQLTEVKTVNKTDEVIQRLKTTMTTKSIAFGSDESITTQFQDIDGLIAIFSVDDFSRFVFFYNNQTSITYCFSDDILFNRGVSLRKFN